MSHYAAQTSSRAGATQENQGTKGTNDAEQGPQYVSNQGCIRFRIPSPFSRKDVGKKCSNSWQKWEMNIKN